jgi:uncharacterized paraquat-inducible protein A
MPYETEPCELPDREDLKQRTCLRCEERFSSSWAGERICPRCKSSNSWRTGTPG